MTTPSVIRGPAWARGDISGSIIDRFDAVAARFPDREAIRSEGTALTYRELATRVADTARVIKESGRDGSPTAILADHGVDAVRSILACIAAGSPYTVLDSSVPAARHRLVLDDFGPTLFLATDALAPFAAAVNSDGLPVVYLESVPYRDARTIASAPGGNSVAGVYYTSGSTGRPKGVVRTHTTILSRTAIDCDFGGFGPSDVMSLVYSYSFGTSVNDLFTALLSGATLSLFNLRRRGLTDLTEWLESERVTVFHAPSGVIRRFVDTLDDHVFQHLRMVIPSGRMYWSDVQRLRRHLPNESVLVSRYASTETSLVCRWSVGTNDDFPGDVVPVGLPVGDVQIELVDDNGDPSVDGSIGEILVTSGTLSPGYWNQSHATQAVFTSADPDTGPVRYRTGDLGRKRRDGLYEFVGRADDRVKVRGNRVELGEVTTELHKLDAVAEAIVVQDVEASEGRLLGYVVMKSGTTGIAGLRPALAAVLPTAMIPSLFIEMDALPLSSSGKIDRQALPPPPAKRPDLDQTYVPPSTPVEKEIATIWSNVLGLPSIGTHDRFVDLGGDSLNAMQVVARTLDAFSVDLTLKALLPQGTVASMATAIEGATREPADTSIRRVPEALPAQASFGQQSLWLAHQFGASANTYNTPKTYDIRGPLDVEALRASLEAVVHRHEILRTTYHNQGGDLVQQVQAPQRFELEPATRRGGADPNRSFDLSADLMLRALLVSESPREHTLSLTTHHIAGDHWSTSLMTDEITLAYRSILRGESPELPALSVQYRDFAAWQRSRFDESQTTNGALEGLTKASIDAVGTLDPLVPSGLTSDPEAPIGIVPFAVDDRLAGGIGAWAADSSLTPFAAALATLSAALARVTGRSTISIGVMVSGRTRSEFEDLIGYFANMVPLRLRVPANSSASDLAEEASAAASDVFACAEVPFEHLVMAVNPRRIANRLPLVDLLLNVSAPRSNTMDLGPARADRMPSRRNSTVAPIDVTIRTDARHFEGDVAFDTSLVQRTAIEQLVTEFLEELGRVAGTARARTGP